MVTAVAVSVEGDELSVGDALVGDSVEGALEVRVAKPPPIGRVSVELMAEATDEADMRLVRNQLVPRRREARDLRGSSLLRIAVGLDEEVVDDVENAILEKNIGTDDLSAATILVLNEETRGIGGKRDSLPGSRNKIGTRIRGRGVRKIRRVKGGAVNDLCSGESQLSSNKGFMTLAWLPKMATKAVWLFWYWLTICWACWNAASLGTNSVNPRAFVSTSSTVLLLPVLLLPSG